VSSDDLPATQTGYNELRRAGLAPLEDPIERLDDVVHVGDAALQQVAAAAPRGRP
jgi:hypothetical protein